MPRLRNFRDSLGSFLHAGNSDYFVRLLLFIILYKAGEYLFDFLESSSATAPTVELAYKGLSAVITDVSVWFYSLFYSDVRTTGGFVMVIDKVPTIRMMKGCTGLMQLFQVWFILLFFPLPLRKKLYFFPISTAVILAASLLHYLMLVPIAWSAPSHFRFFHGVLSRVIFYLFFFLNFLAWNKHSAFTLRRSEQ